MKNILIAIVLLAFFLRVYGLPQNLFFAFEQGRDLKVLSDMAFNHKMTLIGPRTSIDGVYHGILYYYSALIPFLLGKGNPMGVMAFFIFWQSLGTVFFFQFAKELGNKMTAVFGSILYACSFGLIVYSRWLSHPPLIIPFSILLFWSLAKSAVKENFYVLAILAWGAIFHLDLVVAISFMPAILIYFLWQKPKPPTKKIFVFCLILLFLTFLPYLMFDFRHEFLMSNSIKKFLISGATFIAPDFLKAVSHIIFRYTSEIQDVIDANLFFLPIIIFFVSLIWLFLKKKKTAGEKILILWVISLPTLGIMASPIFGLKHYLVGLDAGIILIISLWLTHFRSIFFKIIGILTLLFLILNNIFLIRNWLPINRNVFYLFSQPGMILGSEQKVIDYIYTDSDKKNFGWEAFTIPYWSNAGWDYLFSWYGVKKYKYLSRELKKGENFYVIVEPGGDIGFLNNWLKEQMDKRGKVLKENIFGEIKVQKRSTLYN